jgi:lipoate---protein ligase
MIPFRLIDSGVADGRHQIAYDAALTELHEAGRAPDTLRFLRFPPTVLIGLHQSMQREVQVDRCRAEGVGLVRRVSGGGAIYLDPGQVGWELVFRRGTLPETDLGGIARIICDAVAGGLSDAFGIDARFRPRNDIEVDGRKLSGTGGFWQGDTMVYQGTVLIDMDAARVRDLLNVPAAKLARHGAADVGDRLVTLKALLGEAPSVNAVQEAVRTGLERHLEIITTPDTPNTEERALTEAKLTAEIGTDAFVFGEPEPAGEDVATAETTHPGGTLRADLRLEGPPGGRRIREALVTGDFFVAPPRIILDLEAHLRGLPAAEAANATDAFFAANPAGTLSLPVPAFAAIIAEAISEDAKS